MTRCHNGCTYTGSRTEHCTVCHQTFNSAAAGDRHRTGDHGTTEGPDRRRCRTPDELHELGMTVNAQGRWITEPNPNYSSVTA